MADAATTGTPYQDTSATGSIGLCDKAGHEITSGSVTSHPFAWRAVSTAAATAPYNAVGRTATLYAYQPRQDVAPGDWSGDQLTASTRYTNPAHPMAAATRADDSLQDYMDEFKPEWNGLLELRMYLGGPNQTTDSYTYPAVSIQVTGTTWRVINPVTVSCTAGKAVSTETLLLPSSTTNHAPAKLAPGKLVHHTYAAAHHHRRKSSAAPAKSSPTPAALAGNPTSSANSPTSGSSRTWTITLVAAAAVLILGAGSFRSRRSTTPASQSGHVEESK